MTGPRHSHKVKDHRRRSKIQKAKHKATLALAMLLLDQKKHWGKSGCERMLIIRGCALRQNLLQASKEWEQWFLVQNQFTS
jgi:hypothetical protein